MFGDSGGDTFITAIAVDGASIYVGGYSTATHVAVGGQTAFINKYDTDGYLVWATKLQNDGAQSDITTIANIQIDSNYVIALGTGSDNN